MGTTTKYKIRIKIKEGGIIIEILIGTGLVIAGMIIGFAFNEKDLQDYKKTNEMLLNDLNSYKAACDIYMMERNFYHDAHLIDLKNISKLEKKLEEIRRKETINNIMKEAEECTQGKQ